MSFKNKLLAKFPSKYISYKVKDENEAKEIINGYKAVRKNNLFDDDFYLEKYPKVKSSGMDPLLHYIFFGFSEGKKPNSEFDGVFYKNHYDDVGINPLLHYALYGINDNRVIKPNGADLSEFNGFDKNILFILHEKIGTVGGTGFLNLDIIQHLPDEYSAFILTSDGEDVELWQYNGSLDKIANYPVSFNTDFSVIDNDDNIISKDNFNNIFFNKDLAIIYDEILSKLDINLVHINHLINHSFDLINCVTQKSIPFLVSLHDFYYLCPSIHLVDKDCKYCNFACESCGGISKDKSLSNDEILNKWRKLFKDMLSKSSYNIAPNQSVIESYKKIYSDLDNFKLIEHGVNIDKSSHRPALTSNPCRVLVPGHVSPHKGSLLIKQIKQLDKNNLLELHFMGTTIPNLNSFGVNHGRYERSDFNNIVSEIKPSFSLILSTCPETYSYTLTESWMAGIPVIASNLGALEERISKSDAGWLVDYTNPEDIYNFIININQNDYQNKLSNISKIKFKDINEMCENYIELYNSLTD
ncbi:MAG: glycosyltransferase [Methanobrevibacter sp.]|uniref:glycosyltransferase n=1 Tax=Methanobrevibacter sp. TaxID=66852 RepID=UPI0025DF99F6|nr:glycosyltransferase [Methanobrevibacter sp.]MBR0270955.1 glycosyltransferase [Methanobrevibacter sp.]